MPDGKSAELDPGSETLSLQIVQVNAGVQSDCAEEDTPVGDVCRDLVLFQHSELTTVTRC